jgi:hypothetical protein
MRNKCLPFPLLLFTIDELWELDPTRGTWEREARE